jgi:hypothetical protein
MKKIILVVTVMSFILPAYAQDFVDNALLFSRIRPSGSARIQGIGGAQIALGGDYSSGLSNPAGLGFYNRSEITFSPGINFAKSSASYFGESTSDSKSTFNIPGFSLVFNRPSDNEEGYMGGSFAITMTRINDFNQNYKYSGRNNDNSIIDYFLNDAGDIHPDELLSGGSYFYSLTSLAYRNFLIEDFQDNNGRFYDSPLTFTESTQTEISERRGAQYQWSLAYGANFSDKFYVGASLGINSLRFKLSQRYIENDFDYPANVDPPADEFAIDEEYDIRGSGVNFTLGATYRPIEFLQIGASFVTPTYYSITDSYKAGIQSNWNDYDYYPDVTDDENLNYIDQKFDQALLYEYKLSTPMRLSTGIAFISKFGFITGDVEFVNYRKAKYSSDVAGDFEFENSDIKSELTSVVNYRIGAEFRKGIYRVRAGFGQMEEPFSLGTGVKRTVTLVSGGGGVRINNFFADIAVVSSKTNGSRTPYFVDNNSPNAKLSLSNLDFVVTVGFTFANFGSGSSSY